MDLLYTDIVVGDCILRQIHFLSWIDDIVYIRKPVQTSMDWNTYLFRFALVVIEYVYVQRQGK